LLIAVAYVGFGITALSNIDYPLFATVVECLVVGSLLSSAYLTWMDKGPARAFHAGFAICGGLFLVFVGIIAHNFRYQAPPYVFGPLRNLLLPTSIAYIPWVAAAFERAAYFLASLVVGLFGGWFVVFCSRKQRRVLS
jgi:hypothetical protein